MQPLSASLILRTQDPAFHLSESSVTHLSQQQGKPLTVTCRQSPDQLTGDLIGWSLEAFLQQRMVVGQCFQEFGMFFIMKLIENSFLEEENKTERSI